MSNDTDYKIAMKARDEWIKRSAKYRVDAEAFERVEQTVVLYQSARHSRLSVIEHLHAKADEARDMANEWEERAAGLKPVRAKRGE